MHPVLFSVGGFSLGSYAFFVALSIVAFYLVRKREQRRLGYAKDPRQRYVGLGALLGAIVGAKLGMLLFEPLGDFTQTLTNIFSLNFEGKTVVGGISGGYLGVEIAKKLVGITASTGDGFAVALPLSQGIGRIGCFFHGCCYGSETDSWMGIAVNNIARHPAQLYEALFDFTLAAFLFLTRKTLRPAGQLFRQYLIGYALIRIFCELFRGDSAVWVGPLKLVQWYCLFFAVFFFIMYQKKAAA